MNTQSETIVWHKYPDEKPEVGKVIFVQYMIGGVVRGFDSDMLLRGGAEFTKHVHVIAWAEMPVGWKED